MRPRLYDGLHRLLALSAALGLAACATAAPYRTASLVFDGEAPTTLGTDPDELLIAQVAAQLIRDRLGLPFPAGTAVHLYVNQATLAEGLRREGGLAEPDAREKSRFAAGVASPRGIFLRADRLVSWPLIDRVGLIAHELAHVSQIELRRGGRGAPAQWIREGHADWVKFRVLELLGLRSYQESRDEVRRSVLRSSTPIRLFPSLADLARGDRWGEARNQLGPAATYGQAFLAVDWLVERYGIAKLHEFLRRFALDADPSSHWRAVFPISFPEFVEESRARLERLSP